MTATAVTVVAGARGVGFSFPFYTFFIVYLIGRNASPDLLLFQFLWRKIKVLNLPFKDDLWMRNKFPNIIDFIRDYSGSLHDDGAF